MAKFSLIWAGAIVLTSLMTDTSAAVLKNGKGFKGKCVPYTTWKEDCNTCTCSSRGTAACTLMYCFPQEQTEDTERTCIPFTTWQEDCKTCFCSSTGIAICSPASCFRSKRATPRCTPGDTWYDGCNHCWCNNQGRAACTYRYCFSPVSDIDFDSGGSQGVCFLRPDPGNCYALTPRYYFNKMTQRCERFYYGGCNGNGNNFQTIQECQNTCGGAFSLGKRSA